jgi:hypothetical protein
VIGGGGNLPYRVKAGLGPLLAAEYAKAKLN